ncbi:hypothetical protein [Streptomyces sp. NPDC048057]|uniref:hypothetical protein n=1 Tax=Streptomyces sp. NPDC048057 TaxID=3155628 RepID=UPI0033E5BC1F
MTTPDGWRGATELTPEREAERLAATGIVGYRQDRDQLHHCLHHKPAPANRCADFHAVTADALDHRAICVHWDCGRDLLATAAITTQEQPR